MFVKLHWVTTDAEYKIAYSIRGSNPPNQDNPDYERLFRFCLNREDKHWSVLQMAHMCLQFETSLAVANQVKRHWSLHIHEPLDMQETSMRYMDPFQYEWGFQPIELRKKGATNRQSSEEPLTGAEAAYANNLVQGLLDNIKHVHDELAELGVANECIRMIFPQCMTTRFFIVGSARSWVHYFDQRLPEHAQLEHRQVAEAAFDIFKEQFPMVTKCLFPDRLTVEK